MAQTSAETPSVQDDRPAAAAAEEQQKPSGGVGFAQSADSLQNEAQDGVKAIEAVAMTWSKWGLIVAYIGIFLMAFATSLEGQVSYSMSVFATSSFSSHALVSTVLVVQGVVMAVIKPIMAKVGDVFGRLEAFSVSVLLYVLGYVQQAASRGVDSFASAQIFYSAGSTGTQILQQVFIADTSDLLWRALFSSLPDVPFLVTVWVGPEIVNSLLTTASWRWGYAIWAIVLPVAFAPLAVSLFLNQRKAKRMGLLADDKRNRREGGARGLGASAALGLARELDIVGILLLSAAFALILIPLTIATKQEGGFGNPSVVAMLVVGAVCFVAFPFWEANSRVCPHPLIPLTLLKSKTFCAGCLIGFFYFSKLSLSLFLLRPLTAKSVVFYMSHQPYFYSYLLVVQGVSIPAAGRISQTFSFTSTVTSILVSVAIRYTRRYKYFVTAGALLYLTGVGLMIRYRDVDATVGQLVGTQICVGVGGGMLNVPAQLGVQAASSHQSVAAATAVFLTLVELGGAVGAAVSGAVWSRVVPAALAELLPEGSKGNATAIYSSHVVAMALEWGSPERVAVQGAYQRGMTRLLTVAVCVCVPIVLLSLLMRDIKLDEVEQHVRGRVIGGRVGADEKRAANGGAAGEEAAGQGSGVNLAPGSEMDCKGSPPDPEKLR
ncbi:hypothetical protein RB593_001785 [Gaeumannomyces tritici]